MSHGRTPAMYVRTLEARITELETREKTLVAVACQETDLRKAAEAQIVKLEAAKAHFHDKCTELEIQNEQQAQRLINFEKRAKADIAQMVRMFEELVQLRAVLEKIAAWPARTLGVSQTSIAEEALQAHWPSK